MTRRQWIMAIAAAVVLAGGVYTAIVFWPASAPDPQTADANTVAEFAASDRFAELPAEQRQAYMQRLRTGDRDRRRAMYEQMSEEQQQQFRRNMREMFRQRMTERLKRYFEADEAERKQMLDELIDRMRDRGGRRGPGGEGSGDSARRGRRGPSLDRIKGMIESHTPEQRARFMQFIGDLQQRMKQRGIEPRRGGHGPG